MQSLVQQMKLLNFSFYIYNVYKFRIKNTFEILELLAIYIIYKAYKLQIFKLESTTN